MVHLLLSRRNFMWLFLSTVVWRKNSGMAFSPLVNNYCMKQKSCISINTSVWMGKPKRGSIVDSYQTVSVNCQTCRTKLFRYKKKNGTKSNLVKCYIERISEDSVGLLEAHKDNDDEHWYCPNCQTKFGRDSMIHGRPAIKMIGGKIRMTKK